MDIEANLKSFMADRKSDARYTSFDYCFNYFQGYRERQKIAAIGALENMQISCLQLGFYLASWGMFRGSTLLIGRSAKQFEPVVELIAKTPQEIWEIDAHTYSHEACMQLLSLGDQVKEALRDPVKEFRCPSATLATKVMLGIFGNVPAFDTYVRKGLRHELGVSRFTFGTLQRIGTFYHQNSAAIEQHREQTLDFDTGGPAQRRYSRAKVIDMIFYVEGGARRR